MVTWVFQIVMPVRHSALIFDTRLFVGNTADDVLEAVRQMALMKNGGDENDLHLRAADETSLAATVQEQLQQGAMNFEGSSEEKQGHKWRTGKGNGSENKKKSAPAFRQAPISVTL